MNDVPDAADDADEVEKQLDADRLRRFGEAVRLERLRQRLTQAQLGSRIGVHKNTILAIENAKVDTSLLTAWHVADVLGVHLRDLIE